MRYVKWFIECISITDPEEPEYDLARLRTEWSSDLVPGPRECKSFEETMRHPLGMELKVWLYGK
jgi:hypothetical protein